MTTTQIFAMIWILVGGCFSSFAQEWKQQTNAPAADWTGIASSSDGNKLVAVVFGGGIFTSTNSGFSWSQNTSAPDASWESVASSADGTKLVAVAGNGGYGNTGRIFTSTNSGNTWIEQTNTPFGAAEDLWASVASSANGSKLITVGFYGGEILITTNGGTSWSTASPITFSLRCVASSASGDNLVVGVLGGGIYTSTNSGASWILSTAPNGNWSAVASSADGSKLAASNAGGSIYTSTDAGITWTPTSVPNDIWYSVASSADGSKLATAAGGYQFTGPIYLSTDSGVNWVQADAPNTNWYAVASSADGTQMAAVVFGGGIWTYQITPNPQLHIKVSANKSTLSWIIPSTKFMLQCSSNLVSWSTVTNVPELDFNNLQYQITSPMSSGNSFFRLMAP